MGKNEKIKAAYFAPRFEKKCNEYKNAGPGRTDATIAAALGTTRATIINWKKGKSTPADPVMIDRISELFGVSPDYFELPDADILKYMPDRVQETSDQLRAYCADIGLSLDFLRGIRSMFGADLGWIFPLYSPISYVDGGKFARDRTWIKTAAPDPDNIFQIMIPEKNGIECVMLSKPDLLFLRDLQDRTKLLLQSEFEYRENRITKQEPAAAALLLQYDDDIVTQYEIDSIIDHYSSALLPYNIHARRAGSDRSGEDPED